MFFSYASLQHVIIKSSTKQYLQFLIRILLFDIFQIFFVSFEVSTENTKIFKIIGSISPGLCCKRRTNFKGITPNTFQVRTRATNSLRRPILSCHIKFQNHETTVVQTQLGSNDLVVKGAGYTIPEIPGLKQHECSKVDSAFDFEVDQMSIRKSWGHSS